MLEGPDVGVGVNPPQVPVLKLGDGESGDEDPDGLPVVEELAALFVLLGHVKVSRNQRDD